MFLALLICSVHILNGQSISAPILLWPQGAPGATGNSDEDKPAIIPFIPDATIRNGTAVLVIPGGGFTIRAVDHEGVLVAQWLKSKGITAFLLRYRLRPLYDRNDWVKDGQRAMQYIRAHASEYRIAVNRVGAVGFSAGAHLVGELEFFDSMVETDAAEVLDRFHSTPDFGIMAYGAIAMPQDLSNEKIRKIPPTFMYGTVEDAGSITGMSHLYAEYLKNKIPVEAHFFRNGVHGTGFAIGDPILGDWKELMFTWMKAGGFLSTKTRTAINGIVKLDGSALLRGMVVLTPIENKNDPPVVIYITNTGTGELGRFSVPLDQGPAIGKYKVEVRQEATRWLSNSRDPFMIRMMAKQRDGTLTGDDKNEWAIYLRNKDLSPSIEGQKVFSKKRPKDKMPYIIDIKDDADMILEVFSK